MAGWDDILKELGDTPSQIDYVRRRYLEKLEEYTQRPIIAYYSAFLNHEGPNLDVSDEDMEGFMNALRGIDCSKGLDLILHTPGGDPTAAEAIVNYLKEKFKNDIRAIVPQIAMSAGTMMEDDPKLQDLVLSVHHSFLITFQHTDAVKIIANSNKKDFIVRRG